MNRSFEEIKRITQLGVSDELLLALIFEMSRFFDKQLTKEFKNLQKKNGVVFNSITRKDIRRQFYYGKSIDCSEVDYKIDPCRYTAEDIDNACNDFLWRLNNYNPTKIIESMKQRIYELDTGEATNSNMEKWLNWYAEKRKEKKYSLACIELNQKSFEKNDWNENIITDFIRNSYEDLENYRHLVIVVDGEIYDKKGNAITWNLLFKAGIYAENFVQFKGKFFPHKKEKKIEELTRFLVEKGIANAEELATSFYEAISTGFKFEDCYVSSKQTKKILVFKKIELDQTNVPCPACNSTIQRGNSYPEMFLRSWECTNPSCSERSKSGRGKRFDEFGTYRFFKLVENDDRNKIDETFYKNWHRDIFDESLDYRELLIRTYSWADERILTFLFESGQEDYGRIIENQYSPKDDNRFVNSYSELPIVKLFIGVNNELSKNKQNRTRRLDNNIELFNGDSSTILDSLMEDQIGCAITSPPYYNAREYSQWPNLILYLIDMMINAKAVYNSMERDSYYLYNIGDVVNEDNIYVNSYMTNRRQELGFLSCMVFEIAGFNLVGNIIWDKGEVQSKRNSTVNMFSGYVKCINCYEHILLFKKGNFDEVHNEVFKITPVIKINSKGENTYKHTAPYPPELVAIVKPFAKRDKYILDPYLGSGTTVKWCKDNGYRGIGVELNKEYYELCRENVFS